MDDFIADMNTNRKVGQSRQFQENLLEPGNDETNEYGGNFTQQVLRPPNRDNMQVNGKNTRQMRQALATTTAAPTPPQTSAPQGTGPKTSQVTPTPRMDPPKQPGGYQGQAAGPWETTPVTTSAPPPQNSGDFGRQALSILGTAGAVGLELMRGLFIDPLRGY